MKRKGIKNLIIDFGSVLTNLDRQRCLENLKKLGLSDMRHALDIYHQQDFLQHYERGPISNANFRNVIREKIGKDATDVRIDAAWNSLLVNASTCKLGLLLVLREDYVAYLLSNTSETHWKWPCEHAFPYKTFRVEDYLKHIFLSYEMKMAEPDEEIFQKVLDEAGLDPKRAPFIDDSEANCITAWSLGISTYTPRADGDRSHLFK